MSSDKTHTILVCDDEAHILRVVAAKLRNAGYEVLTAEDGAEALAVARSRTPDLVITDFQMPSMTGQALCVQLRQDARTASVPAIMLTARGFCVSSDELAGTNIQAVLAKPFSPREVLATVKRVLEPLAVGAPAGAIGGPVSQ